MQNHLATGSIFPSWEPQNTNYRGDSYRYGFNGKENDNEVQGTGNQQDYGFRIYDPRLGKWLSVDPLRAKYPDISPFAYCAGNPIYWLDKGGKDLWIGGDREKAMADLQSVVPEEYRPYLVVSNEGQVTWDLARMNEDGVVFNGNESGQILLSKLMESDKNYLYQVADYATEYVQPISKYKYYDLLLESDNGIQNSSTTKREPSYQGENLENANKSRPVSNDLQSFDGVVTISANVKYTEKGISVRKNTVLHELWENWERTENLKPYEDPQYDGRGITLWIAQWINKVLPAANDSGAHQSSVNADSDFYEPCDQAGSPDVTLPN